MRTALLCTLVLLSLSLSLSLPGCHAAKATDLIPVIDIGDEYMKVAVINPRPGYPLFDIALNEQSERKTPVVIGFEQDGEIRVGESALSLKTRAPTRAFFNLMQLLGERAEGEAMQQFLEEFPHFRNIIQTSDTMHASVLVNELGLSIPIEVLLALYMRSILSGFSVGDIHLTSKNVKEVVLVVPDHFQPPKVGLLVLVAELAGFKVKGMVRQLAAAILDYAVGGQNSAAGAVQTVMAFGMGGTTTSASLFTVDRTLEKEKKQRRVVVRSEGLASHASVGGRSFTFVMAHLLSDRFARHKVPKPLHLNHKAVAKIMRAAGEAKETLSFSNSASVTLEKLHEQKDLIASVPLAEFEEAIDPVAEAAVQTIQETLDASNRSLTHITVCELFGGGLRVPLVGKKLAAKYPGMAIGRHINGDEAAVFGAAYLFASAAKLPGAPIELVFEQGPQEEQQSLLRPPMFDARGMEPFKAVLDKIDDFEAKRLAAQHSEEL